ncbi:MAG: mannosyltransferase [Flavobacteriaceae bacterium]|jgi:alpha-1,6-mannosyltransferase|nr:mannosyltransferase [Flavobacteriaceae bacterium]
MLFYIVFAYDLDRSDFIKLIILFGALFFISYKIIQINQDRFWLLAGIGIIFRLLFIAILPNLSQDFYRFIWDGRLIAQGISPYLFTPENYIEDASNSFGAIINQAQKLYKGMGSLNGSHFSNYPPVNQLCFAVASVFAGKSILGSVVVMRIILIAADIGILFIGRKLLLKLHLNPNQIFWYFLNPFIIIELTGNLHFEGVMLFFLIASLYLLHQKKWLGSACLLGISVSVKLIPLLFIPLYYRWFSTDLNKGFFKLAGFYFIVLGTVIFTFTPFLSAQFISNFSETIFLWFQDFEFNASIYYIIRWMGFKIVGWNMIAIIGKILPLFVILVILLFTFLRKNKSTQQLITSMLFGVSIYFLFSTTIHPWYIATPLLLSVFTKYNFPVIWSLAVILSYTAYGVDGFSENLYLVALEYLLVIGFFIWELIQLRKETVFSSKL